MSRNDEAIKAFDIFANLLTEKQQVVTAIELDYCRVNRRAGRFDFERLRNMRASSKRRIGNILLAKYRKDEKVAGEINWAKFAEWCKTHWKAILAIKILLTAMFLLCI